MAMKEWGTKEIAKALNKEGFLTSTGARWTKTYVYKDGMHPVRTGEGYKL
jgi:hypothetical protein